jgi:hypothetical protein
MTSGTITKRSAITATATIHRRVVIRGSRMGVLQFASPIGPGQASPGRDPTDALHHTQG